MTSKKKKKFDYLIKDKPVYIECGARHKYYDVYTISSIDTLNQFIGWVKFTNHGKTVLYRGSTELYKNISPSIFRGQYTEAGQEKQIEKLDKLLKLIYKDYKLAKSLHFDNCFHEYQKRLIVLSVLQHYGIHTDCLDVVDNHWIALWFGLNRYEGKQVKSGYYGTYFPRIDMFDGNPYIPIYQYIYVFVVEKEIDIRGKDKDIADFSCSDQVFAFDLRRLLPSMYIRPHAQHAWMIKSPKRIMLDHQPNFIDNLAYIIKLNSFHVMKWLGNGLLVNQRYLFPGPQYDFGYDVLLKRVDIFEHYPEQIIRYD